MDKEDIDPTHVFYNLIKEMSTKYLYMYKITNFVVSIKKKYGY